MSRSGGGGGTIGAAGGEVRWWRRPGRCGGRRRTPGRLFGTTVGRRWIGQGQTAMAGRPSISDAGGTGALQGWVEGQSGVVRRNLTREIGFGARGRRWPKRLPPLRRRRRAIGPKRLPTLRRRRRSGVVVGTVDIRR